MDTYLFQLYCILYIRRYNDTYIVVSRPTFYLCACNKMHFCGDSVFNKPSNVCYRRLKWCNNTDVHDFYLNKLNHCMLIEVEQICMVTHQNFWWDLIIDIHKCSFRIRNTTYPKLFLFTCCSSMHTCDNNSKELEFKSNVITHLFLNMDLTQLFHIAKYELTWIICFL